MTFSAPKPGKLFSPRVVTVLLPRTLPPKLTWSLPLVSLLSLHIEGARATLVELYAYESAQLFFLEPVDDVREVHNYVTALDLISSMIARIYGLSSIL